MGEASELKVWDFSRTDWTKRLLAKKSLLPDLPLDKNLADQAVSVFNNLRIPDVIGQPLNGVGAGEWQRDIVRAVFGSLMPDGIRRVKSVFCMVPKKNSKTTGGASIMVTALLLNKRPRADFMLIGPSHEVAMKAFSQAAGMIEADPYLKNRFQIQYHVKTIIDLRNKASLRVVTFDMKIATGSRPVGILLDELHVMSTNSDASRIIAQITGGMISTPESFLITITTQSDLEPAGAFKNALHYARGVRDGRIPNGRVLPLIYEFPEDWQRRDDKPWLDQKNWPLVMPNLDLSFTIDALLPEYEQAVEAGDGALRLWASQHLNIEIGLALHDGRWAGADYWLGAKDPEQITLENLIERSEVIVAGGDAGGLDDLLALSVIGRDKVTKDWLHWAHAWAQTDVIEKRKEIAERLRDFERDGDLTISVDAKEDVKQFCDVMERLWKTGKMPVQNGIGLDPASITTIVDELAARGIQTAANGGPIVAAKQSALALSPSIWGLERKLKDGTFWHCGSAMMAWCVSNAKAEQRGNAVLITKQTAGKAKIDPLVATFNAVMLMSMNPEAAGDLKPQLFFL